MCLISYTLTSAPFFSSKLLPTSQGYGWTPRHLIHITKADPLSLSSDGKILAVHFGYYFWPCLYLCRWSSSKCESILQSNIFSISLVFFSILSPDWHVSPASIWLDTDCPCFLKKCWSKSFKVVKKCYKLHQEIIYKKIESDIQLLNPNLVGCKVWKHLNFN